MDHDAEHLSEHHAARRALIARPPAHANLSEIELLRRAARHIRLRTHDEPTSIAGGTEGPSVRKATPLSGSPDVDAAR